MYIDIYVYIHRYLYICVYMYIHVHMCLYTCVFVHMYIRTYIYIYTHIYICIHMLTYIYVYSKRNMTFLLVKTIMIVQSTKIAICHGNTTPLPSSGGSQSKQSNSNPTISQINVAAHNILSLEKRDRTTQ